MKESATLNLVVAKGAGADFISPGESSGYNSAASSINGDHSPVQNDKKRLSVVREEIIDIVDERCVRPLRHRRVRLILILLTANAGGAWWSEA